jgi:hypothetical protein
MRVWLDREGARRFMPAGFVYPVFVIDRVPALWLV